MTVKVTDDVAPAALARFDMVIDVEVADVKHLADITAALRASLHAGGRIPVVLGLSAANGLTHDASADTWDPRVTGISDTASRTRSAMSAAAVAAGTSSSNWTTATNSSPP